MKRLFVTICQSNIWKIFMYIDQIQVSKHSPFHIILLSTKCILAYVLFVCLCTLLFCLVLSFLEDFEETSLAIFEFWDISFSFFLLFFSPLFECFHFHGTSSGPVIDWIKLRVLVISFTHAVDVAKNVSLLLRTFSASGHVKFSEMKSELYMGCITVGPGMPVWLHTLGCFSWLAEAAAAKNDSNCGFISCW